MDGGSRDPNANRDESPCGAVRRSSPTTCRSSCRRRAMARPRPHGSGLTSAMNGPGMVLIRPPPTIGLPSIARASIPPATCTAIRAGCTPTAILASTSSFGPAASARSPAWPISGASSSTSSRLNARSSPRRPSSASPGSTPSRRRGVADRRTSGCGSGRFTPDRSSMTWRASVWSTAGTRPASSLLRPGGPMARRRRCPAALGLGGLPHPAGPSVRPLPRR